MEYLRPSFCIPVTSLVTSLIFSPEVTSKLVFSVYTFCKEPASLAPLTAKTPREATTAVAPTAAVFTFAKDDFKAELSLEVLCLSLVIPLSATLIPVGWNLLNSARTAF